LGVSPLMQFGLNGIVLVALVLWRIAGILSSTTEFRRKQTNSDRRTPVLTCVKFEVLTEVIMKCSIFWDIEPCNPLKVN
jgi:hypothetical protein